MVTAEANAAMTRMLVPILEKIRNLIGFRRRITLVFDRGGWSPKLFQKLLAMNFDLLTYRKGRVRRVAEKRFVLRKAKLEGRPVRYRLHDQAVRFLRGKLRLRQVTRLTDTGKQTPVLTVRGGLKTESGLARNNLIRSIDHDLATKDRSRASGFVQSRHFMLAALGRFNQSHTTIPAPVRKRRKPQIVGSDQSG